MIELIAGAAGFLGELFCATCTLPSGSICHHSSVVAFSQLIDETPIEDEDLEPVTNRRAPGSIAKLQSLWIDLWAKPAGVLASTGDGCELLPNRQPIRGSVPHRPTYVGHLDGVGCTGFVVGPRHILTAAHCLYKRSWKGENGWEVYLAFSPERQVYPKPRIIGWELAIVVKGWVEREDPRLDFGMVVLNENVYLGAEFLALHNQVGEPFHIDGYGHFCQFGQMWHLSCNKRFEAAEVITSDCEGDGGLSGSPVRTSSGAFAVRACRYTEVRLSDKKLKTIRQWIDQYK